MENSKNRIVYADLLRIIATFAVIVLHVSASKWYEAPIREYNWQMFNIYDSLVRWSVPVFVMISGMFFLNPNKEIDFKKLFYKYILRIVLTIIFWGLFYQFSEIFAKFILHHESITMKKIVVAFAKIPFGPPWYHLYICWYRCIEFSQSIQLENNFCIYLYYFLFSGFVYLLQKKSCSILIQD